MKYGESHNCSDCKEEYSKSKHLETSIDVEIGIDTINIILQFDSFWSNIPIKISGERTDDGYIYAYIKIESDNGFAWYEDIWFVERQKKRIFK